MRPHLTAFRRSVGAACALLLGGCAGYSSPHGAPAIPAFERTAATRPGFAISEVYGSHVLVFGADAASNPLPRCRVGASRAAGIDSDENGDLYVPIAGRVVEYAPNCGPMIAQWSSPLAQVIDIAVRGPKLYVAGYGRRNGRGNFVAICENGACASRLTYSSIAIIFGVAVDSAGNVWVSASTAKTNASLFVWPNGTMPGRRVRGYVNPDPGGLDFTNGGTLLAVDSFTPNVYGYRCDARSARCDRAGTWPLQGESFFGKLDRRNQLYEAPDYNDGRVDVYAYPGFAYLYSYGKGLDASLHVGGIAPLPE
jgi:hypothetical protein